MCNYLSLSFLAAAITYKKHRGLSHSCLFSFLFFFYQLLFRLLHLVEHLENANVTAGIISISHSLFCFCCGFHLFFSTGPACPVNAFSCASQQADQLNNTRIDTIPSSSFGHHAEGHTFVLSASLSLSFFLPPFFILHYRQHPATLLLAHLIRCADVVFMLISGIKQHVSIESLCPTCQWSRLRIPMVFPPRRHFLFIDCEMISTQLILAQVSSFKYRFNIYKYVYIFYWVRLTRLRRAKRAPAALYSPQRECGVVWCRGGGGRGCNPGVAKSSITATDQRRFVALYAVTLVCVTKVRLHVFSIVFISFYLFTFYFVFEIDRTIGISFQLGQKGKLKKSEMLCSKM